MENATFREILRREMSQENVDVVAQLVEAWNRRDVDGILTQFDRHCEVVFPPDVPEPGPFHGHAQLRDWAEGFLAAWQSHRAEIVDVVEVDDHVLAMLHLVGQGGGSGIEFDETDAHVFTFRGAKITCWQNFNERSEALEAVGLSE
jgi:ketosteroid isomerase-like protein